MFCEQGVDAVESGAEVMNSGSNAREEDESTGES